LGRKHKALYTPFYPEWRGSARLQVNNPDSGATYGFSATGDRHNTDSMLGPLADNGGPTVGLGQATLTHALLSDSPTIGAVTGGGGYPGTGQRGVSRPVDLNSISLLSRQGPSLRGSNLLVRATQA
jgi:hypothetical protein